MSGTTCTDCNSTKLAEDERVPYMFCRVFVDTKLVSRYLNGLATSRRYWIHRPRISLVAQAMLRPRAFEMHLYSHALTLLEYCLLTKLMSTVHNYNIGLRLRYAIQVVEKPWIASTLPAGLRSSPVTLEPYMFYNNGTVAFEVTGSCDEGYAPQLQRTYLAGGDRFVRRSETAIGSAAQKGLDHSDAIDVALGDITSALFSRLDALVENSQLYPLNDEDLSHLPAVTMCQLET